MIDLVISSRTLLLTVSYLLAVIFLFNGIILLTKHATNPNDPKASVGRIFRMFIAAGCLANIMTVGTMFAGSITGNGSVCGLVEQVDISLFASEDKRCLDISQSELVKSETLEKLAGKDKVDAFKTAAKRIAILFLLIQTIGLYYFIKSFCLLISISNGASATTYGTVFVMMIFSSIALDIKSAIVLVISTFTELAKF